jgi:putative flippase GtrA
LVGKSCKPDIVLGNLTLPELAIGMAIFTAFMVWDIYVFGDNMRKTDLPKSFQLQGKAVLIVLGALQITGWVLVGVSRAADA